MVIDFEVPKEYENINEKFVFYMFNNQLLDVAIFIIKLAVSKPIYLNFFYLYFYKKYATLFLKGYGVDGTS